MKHKILQLMAYIYMPLIFTLVGYYVVYIAVTPVIDMLQAVGSMVVAKEIPQFNSELESIYEEVNTQEKQPSDTSVVPITEIEFPENETHYANFTCKRVKLDAPVYWGDTKAILKAGVGHYMGSFLPGFGKSILLSAHNTTYFKPLQSIKVDDVITYRTNYGVFEYQVVEVKVLRGVEAVAMRDELLSYQEEKLIMYTCYPFETLVGTKTDRLFVFADKISGPTVE